jgi:hypothetical protein
MESNSPRRKLLLAWFFSPILLWMACVAVFAVGSGTMDMLEFDNRVIFRNLKLQICRECNPLDGENRCFCETTDSDTFDRLGCVVTSTMNNGTITTKECIRHIAVRDTEDISSISLMISDSTWAIGYFSIGVVLNAAAWFCYQQTATLNTREISMKYYVISRTCSIIGAIAALLVIFVPITLPALRIVHAVAFVMWVLSLTIWSILEAVQYKQSVEPDGTTEGISRGECLYARAVCLCFGACGLLVGHLLSEKWPIVFLFVQFGFLVIHVITGFILIRDMDKFIDIYIQIDPIQSIKIATTPFAESFES